MSDSNTIQAVRYHDYGGPEVLKVEGVSRPQVSPGMVLVRVKAAGVNPFDWKLRSGAFRQFMPVQMPHVPGVDLAGVIEEVGPGVTEFRPGQAVYGGGSGTYAEYTVAPAAGLAPKPAKLSFDEAAAVPVGAVTAWRALFEAADLQSGQHILVQGGAGGVGHFAVEFARRQGAHVSATASAANLDFVRSQGAETVIDYAATRFETVVHDLDVVLDTVGGDVLERSYGVVRRGGVLVTVAGMPSEEKARAQGVRIASLGPADPAHAGELLRKIGELIDAGQVKVVVAAVYPLAEAARAQAQSETGHSRGRIVLHLAD